jgi:hypothetical protein
VRTKHGFRNFVRKPFGPVRPKQFHFQVSDNLFRLGFDCSNSFPSRHGRPGNRESFIPSLTPWDDGPAGRFTESRSETPFPSYGNWEGGVQAGHSSTHAGGRLIIFAGGHDSLSKSRKPRKRCWSPAEWQGLRHRFLQPEARNRSSWAQAKRRFLMVGVWILKIFKAGIQFRSLRCHSFENGSWGVIRKCSLG